MGEAREVLDRFTDAFVRGDLEAAANCYAEDAVAVTPDEGELHGRSQCFVEGLGPPQIRGWYLDGNRIPPQHIGTSYFTAGQLQ